MASLYEFLCYHSLSSTDQFLEELLFCLPTSFHSHTFDYNIYEHSLDQESVHLIDSSISAFYSDDWTYFFKRVFLGNFKNFTTRTAQDIQEGRRPRTTDNPKEGPRL